MIYRTFDAKVTIPLHKNIESMFFRTFWLTFHHIIHFFIIISHLFYLEDFDLKMSDTLYLSVFIIIQI